MADETPTIAILGAGVAGLCMGIRLKQAGIHSFTIYEKSERVGGTWHDNTYPGAGCDVPSHLYCFSFEPNPDWTRKFSDQAEILRYLEHCAEKYGLRPHLRFGTEIAEGRFDETAGTWRLRTRAGEEIEAQVVVCGTGQLNRPAVPDIPGLREFGGTVFHSARWNHAHDLRGRRVAVVGNGASALQFIPQIAPVAEHVTVFQRSANWVIPRMDRAYARLEKWLFRHVAPLRWLYRAWIYWSLEARFLAFFKGSRVGEKIAQVATEYMQTHIADPALRRALTPDYPVGCKRILISDDYFQALARPNVTIETHPISRIAPGAVVTADGVAHPADTIVFATGFQTLSFLAPMRITGLDGRTLDDAWRDGAEAYLGMAVAGFPNLFLLYGPNTNLGHNSIIFMIECQVGWVLRCIQALHERRLAWLDVRPEVMAAYNVELQAALRETAWDAGCTSWYKSESGKVINNWSGFTVAYWWRTRRPDWAALEARTRESLAARVPARATLAS
jgi:cation diffusion facilitator CzcD-associated flavoprotein CzcO